MFRSPRAREVGDGTEHGHGRVGEHRHPQRLTALGHAGALGQCPWWTLEFSVMTVTWSSLHRLLGISPSPLTRDLVDQAVDAGVAESHDLDWKQKLPEKNDVLKDEFVKDVAAMANSGGGLLVYGVVADGAAASCVKPVSVDERVELQLRPLAGSRIKPAVSGVQFIALADADDPRQGVLVVAVPASPGAPHLIEQRESLRVPYRDGATTRYMTERQIEQAYADRFERRAVERDELSRLVGETADLLDFEGGAWIVGVAHPRLPRVGVLPEPTRDDAKSVLKSALKIAGKIAKGLSGRSGLLPELGDAALNPRVGLRRWMAQSSPNSPSGLSTYRHAEIHHDGTVIFASRLAVANSLDGDRCAVHAELVENFVIDLVGLAEASARARSVDVPMAVRVDLLRPDVDKPFAVVTPHLDGGRLLSSQAEQPPWTRTLRRFTPAECELPASADFDTVQNLTAGLAQDVLHQFGYDILRVLPKPKQPSSAAS